ncbi:MAG: aspartyl protease family protein [Bdellovibrionales bacterium]
MPLLTLKFDSEIGPILEIGISKPASLITAGPPATLTRSKFLIDTGAACTSINPRLAQELNLPIIGKIQLRSVTHEIPSNLYLADMSLTLSQTITLTDIRLMEFPMAGHGMDGLLGRDILQSCLFTVNGPDNSITLAC